jgi:hypothetical protein
MSTWSENSVGVVARLWDKRPGGVVQFSAGARHFILSTSSILAPGPNEPHIQREVGHSPPFSPKVKNLLSYIPNLGLGLPP